MVTWIQDVRGRVQVRVKHIPTVLDSLLDRSVLVVRKLESSPFSGHEFVDSNAIFEFAHARKDLAGRWVVAVGQAQRLIGLGGDG